MNKEQMELFEQMQLVFAKKDDIEKLRQETNANFRKLKEENKELILGWIEGIKTEMEGLRKGARGDIEPFQEGIKEEMKKLELKIQSILFQSIQSIESSLLKMQEEARLFIQQSRQELGSSLQTTKDETQAAILQSRQEMVSYLQSAREEGKINLSQAREETKVDLNRLGEGMGNLSGQIRAAIEEIIAFNEKIKEGFNEVKEELGSMIKFSYADLEKRFATLEARVKSLEKLVLP
ncbi:MAG: hypothetical protein FJ115_05215 [Deltaproteobacteria bacterium]|nr:hypothetical protein [Deltaproteobacteria bacterium]